MCGGPLQMQPTPERIANPQNPYGMSKHGEEMVAINLGRRYGIPTVALRYSIVQGPAAVGLQRLLRGLPDLQPALPAGQRAGAVRGRAGDPGLRQHP